MNHQRKAMTADQFVSYWLSSDEDGEPCLLHRNEENLAEREAQFASECGLFGDAGPGQGSTIRTMRTELADVKARLRQLGAAV